MTTNLVGFLTWWTVPEVRVPYSDLAELAQQTGFPVSLLPSPPDPRNVWRKATNVGARGRKLQAPDPLVKQIEADYGVEPVVKLLTRRVNESQPRLVRHLVREAVIPLADRPAKQLALDTVAVLEFDTNTNKAQETLLTDHQGWANGQVKGIVAEMGQEMLDLMGNADASEVRYSIRKLLEGIFNITMRGSGGVYFVPVTAPGAKDKLMALRRFIRGLAKWQVGDLTPNCHVVSLQGDDAFEMYDDIKAGAITHFKAALQAVADKVAPVLAGTATGKVAEKVNQQAMEAFLEAKTGIAAYREALEDDLGQLDMVLAMAQKAVLKAQQAGD